MTREEAIKMFRKEIECLSHSRCEDCILEKACDPMKTPLDSEYIEAYEISIKALEQEQARWIPVSERVPEDGEEVLCCLGSEEMAVLFRRNDWGQDEWVDGGFATGSYDVVAWMPLPLPFRAESEVDS